MQIGGPIEWTQTHAFVNSLQANVAGAGLPSSFSKAWIGAVNDLPGNPDYAIIQQISYSATVAQNGNVDGNHYIVMGDFSGKFDFLGAILPLGATSAAGTCQSGSVSNPLTVIRCAVPLQAINFRVFQVSAAQDDTLVPSGTALYNSVPNGFVSIMVNFIRLQRSSHNSRNA